MARVNYTGVPEAEPQASAPEDYEREQATPEETGGLIAEGLGKLGEGASTAAKFYGQVAADHATNNFLQQRSALLYGDPSKGAAVDSDGNAIVGPDGAPIYNGGYFGMRGADAMRAYPEVKQKLEDMLSEGSDGLSTPESRLQFDSEARRYYAQSLNEMGSHADQQQKAWSVDTNNTSALLALNALSRKPDDLGTINQTSETVRKSYVRNAQIMGESPVGAQLKADQAVAKMQVDALLPTDPIKAQRVLAANQGVLSSLPDYDYLSYRVEDRANTARAMALSDILMGTAPPNAPSNPNNLGNVKAATGGFAQPSTPLDGAILTANNLRDGYKGMTLTQIGKKWEGTTPTNIANWVSNVSRTTGIAPDAVPNLDDAATLNKMLSGIAVAEKTPAERKTFSSQIISQGVDASLKGQRANLSTPSGVSESGISALLDDLPHNQREEVTQRAVSDMHRRILEARELHAAIDDPTTTVTMWHQIDIGQFTAEDVVNATHAGLVTTATGTEMMKAIDMGPKRSGTEKDAFDILKSAMNGGAIEAGQFDIFGTHKAEAATSWAEAQGEWNRRVGGGEQPINVLTDMIPRYAPQTKRPTWLQPLRFGQTVQSVADVNKAALATYHAAAAKQITQAEYDAEVQLLNRYKQFYIAEDQAQKARDVANKIKAPKPANNVTVTPGETP